MELATAGKFSSANLKVCFMALPIWIQHLCTVCHNLCGGNESVKFFVVTNALRLNFIKIYNTNKDIKKVEEKFMEKEIDSDILKNAVEAQDYKVTSIE